MPSSAKPDVPSVLGRCGIAWKKHGEGSELLGDREEHPQSPGSSRHPLFPPRRLATLHCNTRGGRERASGKAENTRAPSPSTLAQHHSVPVGAGARRRGGGRTQHPPSTAPAVEALQSRGGSPQPPSTRELVVPTGCSTHAIAARSQVIQEAPASPMRLNPPQVPVCTPRHQPPASQKATCPPGRLRGAPSIVGPTVGPTRSAAALPILPADPPPRGNSGQISQGGAEVLVPSRCRAISIPTPTAHSRRSSRTASRRGDAQPRQLQPTSHFILIFFFPPKGKKKNPNNPKNL